LGAPKVGLGRAHVLKDLLAQRRRALELALLANAPEKLHADMPRRLARQRVQQERLDGELVARAEGGTVPDIGDGFPLAAVSEVPRARNVDAVRRDPFRPRRQIQRWHG